MNYPRLDHATLLALDFETHDPGLKELGPGPRRGNTILGAAISDGEQSWYFHYSDTLFPWLNQYGDRDWVFANALYDMDFGIHYGLRITGNLYDIQIAEPLIDEYRSSYSLDSLARDYLGRHKEKTEIDAYALSHKLRGDPRQYLYQMPQEMVAKYAKEDALLTHNIFCEQEPILRKHALWPVFMLETDLLKLLLRMKQIGVRIDTGKIEHTIESVQTELEAEQSALNDMAGMRVNVNSSRQLATVFRSLNLPFGHTKKGTPSFTAEFLESQNHDVAARILRVRQLLKLDGTFLTGLKRFIVNNRIHTTFHPLRSDLYGTVSGRLSASKPNLQQIPSRQTFAKNAVRGLFVPEDEQDWIKIDYSQIEQRLLVHYALGPGAKDIQTLYWNNPDTDFHTETARLASVQRSLAKTINFGINYGMGAKKLARTLGIDQAEAYRFLNTYHDRLPFLKTTFNRVQDTFTARGYIRTIAGRRAHYTGTASHVALNRLIQGSAADVMKQAMVNAYQKGLFDVLTPHLTVHDEIDVSAPRTPDGEEAVTELAKTFETVYDLHVPLRVDVERGPNWADVE